MTGGPATAEAFGPSPPGHAGVRGVKRPAKPEFAGSSRNGAQGRALCPGGSPLAAEYTTAEER